MNTRFGRSITASGNRFAVAARTATYAPPGRGAVYVYDMSSGTAVLEGLLLSPCVENGGFSYDIYLDGDTLAVSAHAESCGNIGLNQGSVHMYERGPAGWSLAQTITGTGVPAFGRSVAVDGDRMVAGSLGRDTICYVRSSGTWVETQRFPNPNFSSESQFGSDVQIDGDILTIADHWDSFQIGVRPGNVRIYRWQNGLWVFEQQIATADVTATPVINDLFGVSVSAHNGRILVGSPRQSGVTGAAVTTGAAYLFEQLGGVWVETARFDHPPETLEASYFGTGVAMTDDVILIGSPGFALPGFGQTGTAWTYWLDLGVQTCVGQVNSTGSAAKLRVTGQRQAANEILELRADDLPPQAFLYFLASQTTGFSPQPGGSQGDLCLGGTVARLIQWGGQADATGRYATTIDPTQLPTWPIASVIQPGETWSFQGWYRDANPTPTSNFTEARSVTFE